MTVQNFEAKPVLPAALVESSSFQLVAGLSFGTILKMFLSMAQAEVDWVLLGHIIVQGELPGGGGAAWIIDQVTVAQADKVFPDPIGRAVALRLVSLALALFHHTATPVVPA